MGLQILFWLFVAVDAAAIGLVFVLGLAAAGPSRTDPVAVVVATLVVPGALLAGAIALFLRSPSPALRVLACVVAAAPLGVLAGARLLAGWQAQANPGGIHGETPLTRALRELPGDPTAVERMRELLAAGADPDRPGEELPLVLAIRAARAIGDVPVRMLLDAGADPNAVDAFGTPAFFHATGAVADPALMQLLLDRGARPEATARDGRSAAWSAVNTRNWEVARRLVERGAPVSGRSPMGLSLLDTLEAHVRVHGDAEDLAPLLAAVRARSGG